MINAGVMTGMIPVEMVKYHSRIFLIRKNLKHYHQQPIGHLNLTYKLNYRAQKQNQNDLIIERFQLCC